MVGNKKDKATLDLVMLCIVVLSMLGNIFQAIELDNAEAALHKVSRLSAELIEEKTAIVKRVEVMEVICGDF